MQPARKHCGCLIAEKSMEQAVIVEAKMSDTPADVRRHRRCGQQGANWPGGSRWRGAWPPGCQRQAQAQPPSWHSASCSEGLFWRHGCATGTACRRLPCREFRLFLMHPSALCLAPLDTANPSKEDVAAAV